MENGLIIHVDFYKGSGKWYAGGEVNIGEARMWQGDKAFMQAIVDNQSVMQDSWIGHYHVVTRDLAKHDYDSNYREFCGGLFQAERFAGMERQAKREEAGA